MRRISKFTAFAILLMTLIIGCKDDEIGPSGPGFSDVAVEVILPSGSGTDLSEATLVSLGAFSPVADDNTGILPFINGSAELAYLVDAEDNLMMAGFLTDNRKEVSMATTAEVMLYMALDYYLLDEAVKPPFLNSVRQIAGFDGFVSDLETLFASNPTMYQDGDYLDALKAKLDQIGRLPAPGRTTSTDDTEDRIFINDVKTKSGLTISSLSADEVQLQNSFPRRTEVFVYKKSYYDRDGNLVEDANYLDTPRERFRLKPGEVNDIVDFPVGSQLSQVTTQMASNDLASTSDPISLPVNEASEFVADYEMIIIGSGSENELDRDLTDAEQAARDELNIEAYALDYLLPTILDIGGNKDLMPAFGSSKEVALLAAVRPSIELNPTVLAAVKNHEFKDASEILLPELYGDIRLSNELRDLLKEVYNILSDGGNLPETFVQGNELIETGYPRFQLIMQAMTANMVFEEKTNQGFIRTEAREVESWVISSIDAEVNMVPQETELCLGEATEIRASLITFLEPEVEEFEFHWTTSNEYGGRVQDINDDPSNFGANIITSGNIVSYISTATESQLGSGSNPETVTCVIYTKNLTTGELTEVDRDEMTVNNIKGCVSFYVPFTPEVRINEFTSLLCNNDTEYSLGHPTYVATFTAVEDAVGYRGSVKRADGTFAAEFTMSNIAEDGDTRTFRMGVGPIEVFLTCSEQEALEEQQERLDYLEEVGHQGIQITPIF